MKVSVDRSALVAGLRKARRVVAEGSPFPALRCVRVIATEEDYPRLVLRATDASTHLDVVVDPEGTVVDTPGEVALDARDLARQLSGDADRVEVITTSVSWLWREGRAVRVQPSPRHLPAGLHGQDLSDLPDASGATFPEAPPVPDGPRSTVPARALREALRRVVFSASVDETREHICGVRLERLPGEGGTLRLSSTDGHRLSRLDADLPLFSLPKGGATISRLALEVLMSVLPRGTDAGVALSVEDGWLHAERALDFRLAARLRRGAFPPADAVIPKDHPRAVELDRAALLAAVDLHKKADGFTLGLREGTVVLPGGKSLPADRTGAAGGPDTILLEPLYLLEVLREGLRGGRVRVEYGGALDPLVFRDPADPGYLHVLMPRRK